MMYIKLKWNKIEIIQEQLKTELQGRRYNSVMWLVAAKRVSKSVYTVYIYTKYIYIRLCNGP